MAFKKKGFKRLGPPKEEEYPEMEMELEEEEDLPPLPTPPKKKVVRKAQPTSTWEVREVPVQTQEAIYNTQTEEYLTMHQALVKILNEME